MKITNARFLDPEHTRIEAEIDGVTVQEVGGGEGDSRIRHWLGNGNTPAPYVAPPPPAPQPSMSELLDALTKTEYNAARKGEPKDLDSLMASQNRPGVDDPRIVRVAKAAGIVAQDWFGRVKP